jgi:hypothetical protein
MTADTSILRDEAGLQAIIGRTPTAVHLKVINHLDEMPLSGFLAPRSPS